MGLRERAQVVVEQAPRCRFAQVWDERLTDDDRAFLADLLADEDTTTAYISSLLNAEGHSLKGQAVARHRAIVGGEKCSCLRTRTYVAP